MSAQDVRDGVPASTSPRMPLPVRRPAGAKAYAHLSDDARDAMSLPPRDRGRRFGVQVGRWFVGISREATR